MSFIDEIGKDVWSWLKGKWKPLSKCKRVLLSIGAFMIIAIIFTPKLWNEWTEWRTGINNMFCSGVKADSSKTEPVNTTIFNSDSFKLKEVIAEPSMVETETTKIAPSTSLIIKDTLQVQIGKICQCFNGEVRIYIQTIQDRPPLKIIGRVNDEEITACDEMSKPQVMGNHSIRVLHLEEDFANFEITKIK